MHSKPLSYLDEYSFRYIQMAFCCDMTGSMEEYIEMVRETIYDTVEAFEKMKFYQYQFAFVGYRDHGDEETTFLTKHRDFADGETIMQFIENQVDAEGGGDFPEAVLDGLDACARKLSWKPKGKSVKVVFHVADAPPHGKEYYKGHDDYPEGCPNGLTIAGVSERFRDKDIKYILLDCSEEDENPLRNMKHVFSDDEHFGYFKEYKINQGIKMLDTVVTFLNKAFEKDNVKLRIDIGRDLSS